MQNHPGGININNWGTAIQTFHQNTYEYDFHFTFSVLQTNNEIPNRDKARARYHTRKLYQHLERQPPNYYRRITNWVTDLTKEVIFVDDVYASVVSLVQRVENAEGPRHATMREIMCGYTLATSEMGIQHDRELLTGMMLDLHILQNVVPHNHIIRLISLDASRNMDRLIVIQELSMPFIHFVQTNAFVGREHKYQVFRDAEANTYLIWCVASALSHLVSYNIALGGKILEAIYFSFDGVPKLGSFIDAVYANNGDNNDAHRDDVAALAGLVVALSNRKMPQNALDAISDDFYHTQPPFKDSYLACQEAFPPLFGPEWAGIFMPGDSGFHFVRNFLAEFPHYNNLAVDLHINPAVYDYRPLIFNRPQFFNPEPLDPNAPDLRPIVHLQDLTNWNALNLELQISLDQDLNHTYPINIVRNTAPARAYTAVMMNLLNAIVEPPPILPPSDSEEDSDAENEPPIPGVVNLQANPGQPPLLPDQFVFIPQECAFIYRIIVDMHNQLIPEANQGQPQGDDISGLNRVYVHPLEGNGARVLNMRMQVVSGVALDEDDVPVDV